MQYYNLAACEQVIWTLSEKLKKEKKTFCQQVDKQTISALGKGALNKKNERGEKK